MGVRVESKAAPDRSKRPTRADVARLAGVSVATVSYVINGSPERIRPSTRRRVLAAVKKLNYRPHAIAQSLRTGRTHTVGLIIPTLASPGMAKMADIVQKTMAGSGHAVIVASSRENQSREMELVELMASQSVDGVLLCPVGTRPYPQLDLLRQRGIPLVFMDRRIPDHEADAVLTDNVRAAYTATRYLIEQGCRSLLCVLFSNRAASALDRLEGFRLALHAAGVGSDEAPCLVVDDPTGELAAASFVAFTKEHGAPDGVLCTTEEIGMSLLPTLREQWTEAAPPRIVLFDAGWAGMLAPPLPTVAQDFEEIAGKAAQFLLDRLGGSVEPPQLVFVDAAFRTWQSEVG